MRALVYHDCTRYDADLAVKLHVPETENRRNMMSNVVKTVFLIATIALELATSVHAQSYSSPTHHYRHQHTVQRKITTIGGFYNYPPRYGYDSSYPASDTAAALDE